MPQTVTYRGPERPSDRSTVYLVEHPPKSGAYTRLDKGVPTLVADDLARDLVEEHNGHSFQVGEDAYAGQSVHRLTHLAAQRDLEVTGTGAGGRVVKDDLVTALTEADAAETEKPD